MVWSNLSLSDTLRFSFVLIHLHSEKYQKAVHQHPGRVFVRSHQFISLSLLNDHDMKTFSSRIVDKGQKEVTIQRAGLSAKGCWFCNSCVDPLNSFYYVCYGLCTHGVCEGKQATQKGLLCRGCSAHNESGSLNPFKRRGSSTKRK